MLRVGRKNIAQGEKQSEASLCAYVHVGELEETDWGIAARSAV